MSALVIYGSDNFWANKDRLLFLVKHYAREATSTSDQKVRNENIIKMKKIVNFVDRQLELYAPVWYPLTPAKCEFRGSISSFHELITWIIKNPEAVSQVEKW